MKLERYWLNLINVYRTTFEFCHYFTNYTFKEGATKLGAYAAVK